MAYEFNGTTQYISAAAASSGATPLTICAWIRPLDNPNNATNVRSQGGLSDDTTSTRAAMLYRFSNGFHAWHSNQQSALTGGMVLNTWFFGGGTFSSLTARQVFRDTTAGTTNTTATSAVSANKTTIGAYFNGATVSGYSRDDIAEFGIWTVVLTNEELASLAKGFPPRRIRPQSLVFYAPLVREIQDQRQGLALTNNNSATVSIHPRRYG